jgi:FAD:protein FMN transferase
MMMSDAPGSRPSRRDFLALGGGAFAITALAGIGWRERRLVRRTVPIMGTTAEISVLTRDPRHAQAAIGAALDALYGVQRAMSRFDATSDIGRANLAAYGRTVPIGNETAVVIAAAMHWACAPGAVFDPCLGRVAELWDVNHRTAPPPLTDVRRFAGRNLARHIELTRSRGSDAVVFHDADVALDLGGIAKGYGVDRAVAALRDWGITDGIVNVGGDLYALGRPLDDEAWQVGVRSSEQPDRIERVIPLTNAAVATSGDYEQFFDYAGTRYHHILDPATAAPRRVVAHSVTVAADDCMTADAAATAVFGLEPAAAAAALRIAAPHARLI